MADSPYRYGKTQQFRDLIVRCRKLGIPSMTFKGTTKIHGTNCGVRFDQKGDSPNYKCTGMSRKQDLDVNDKDLKHMGFAQFVADNEGDLQWINTGLRGDHNIGADETVVIYGEWAGKGVLQGCGIHKMETKRFFIFSACVQRGEDFIWLDIENMNAGANDRIRSMFDYGIYSIEVNFTDPEPARTVLEAITLGIEKQCPVAEAFDCEGIGEGVVWTNIDENGYKTMFKTKGDEHRSASKNKLVVEIEPQLLANITEFVGYAVTVNRVQQAMDEMQATDRGFTGKVLQWVAKDIMAEESDVLEKSELTWKDVANGCNQAARTIFFKKLDETC